MQILFVRCLPTAVRVFNLRSTVFRICDFSLCKLCDRVFERGNFFATNSCHPHFTFAVFIFCQKFVTTRPVYSFANRKSKIGIMPPHLTLPFFATWQKSAAKLSPVEDARTTVDRCLRGMLSTFSKVGNLSLYNELLVVVHVPHLSQNWAHYHSSDCVW